MKAYPSHLILAALIWLPVMTQAANKKKAAPIPTVDTAAVALIKPYDKDGDFEISADELKAMQADYKANPNGPLSALDLTHDRIFDDFDRMSMNNKLGAAKMAANPVTPVAPAKKKKK